MQIEKPLPETLCHNCRHYIINGWCTAKHQSAWYQRPKCERFEEGMPHGVYKEDEQWETT